MMPAGIAQAPLAFGRLCCARHGSGSDHWAARGQYTAAVLRLGSWPGIAWSCRCVPVSPCRSCLPRIGGWTLRWASRPRLCRGGSSPARSFGAEYLIARTWPVTSNLFALYACVMGCFEPASRPRFRAGSDRSKSYPRALPLPCLLPTQICEPLTRWDCAANPLLRRWSNITSIDLDSVPAGELGPIDARRPGAPAGYGRVFAG